MNASMATYLVHLSNVLMLAAYSVKDILWLRWFAVAAALTNIPFFLLQPEVLWPPVLWGGVFTVINLYQIARIYLERRPVVLSDDEQRLYNLAFRSLRPREFVSLTLAGEWMDGVAGDKLLIEGEPVTSIGIAVTGTLDVRQRGEYVGRLDAGQIIGPGLALSGSPSPFDAAFTGPARYIRWPLSSIRVFLDKRPELRVAIQGLVNRDLADKLERLAESRTAPR